MSMFDPRAAEVFKHPGAFLLGAVKAFRANQGLLLAGAVAYYALLSIVPLLILIVIALSKFIDEAELLETMGRYLEWVIPSQSVPIVHELSNFLEHRDFIGWILLLTMLFFSSLAFTVLENAMSVIFLHRVAVRRRRYLISAVMPYLYILTLGIGFMLITLVSNRIEAMGDQSIVFLGYNWGLTRFSAVLLYLLGLLGELCILTSVYLVMPVGRLSLRHSLIGGITATLLWEVTRHLLVWYFARLSQVSVLYGSLTTAIVVLLTMEIGATLLLFGAQVISEYERVIAGKQDEPPKPLRTDPPVTGPPKPS
jgi:membrane protein